MAGASPRNNLTHNGQLTKKNPNEIWQGFLLANPVFRVLSETKCRALVATPTTKGSQHVNSCIYNSQLQKGLADVGM